MSMSDTGVGTEKPQLTVPVAGRSIWISTTSPSMISVSSLVGQTAQPGSAGPGHPGSLTRTMGKQRGYPRGHSLDPDTNGTAEGLR